MHMYLSVSGWSRLAHTALLNHVFQSFFPANLSTSALQLTPWGDESDKGSEADEERGEAGLEPLLEQAQSMQ